MLHVSPSDPKSSEWPFGRFGEFLSRSLCSIETLSIRLLDPDSGGLITNLSSISSLRHLDLDYTYPYPTDISLLLRALIIHPGTSAPSFLPVLQTLKITGTLKCSFEELFTMAASRIDHLRSLEIRFCNGSKDTDGHSDLLSVFRRIELLQHDTFAVKMVLDHPVSKRAK